MLSRFFTLAALIGFLLQAALAQYKPGTDANPPGLAFMLATTSHQKTFHLGEKIEIVEAYSSSVPGMFSLFQNPLRVEGGADSSLAISPDTGVIDRVHNDGKVGAADILNANCMGGTGGGGGCGDCDAIFRLNSVPVRFPYLLNQRLAITAPGHYRIQARAANVALSNDLTKPIPIISTALEIDVVRDDQWSYQQLQLAVDRFDKARRKYLLKRWSPDVTDPTEAAEQLEVATEIENSAEIIRFLDTEDSLQQAVRLFDGEPRVALYENPLLTTILESSHRDLAVSLLATRMADDDFIVSADFIDTLTAMTIQLEQPIVFERHDRSSRQQLNPRTLEILRRYVLALGRSLPDKQMRAREQGMATFERYASEEYCTGEPLIEKRVADQIRLQGQSKSTPETE
jgi:hypothetical protein